jgi:5-methylcytosine-specific restriction protein A
MRSCAAPEPVSKTFFRWSVGNVKKVELNSRFFLIRLGSDPRGLVGSGWTRSDVLEAPHWIPEKRDTGALAKYVSIEFDVLVSEPLVSFKELEREPFAAMHWPIRMSGVRVVSAVTERLEAIWAERTINLHESGTDEKIVQTSIMEGRATRVYVNKYERSSSARKRCLQHHGYQCAVCDVLLSRVYGPVADKLIHVHHLRPLGEISGKYQVNPEEDLRPVCPNCHAVIHSRNPPWTPDEIRAMLQEHGKSSASRHE